MFTTTESGSADSDTEATYGDTMVSGSPSGMGTLNESVYEIPGSISTVGTVPEAELEQMRESLIELPEEQKETCPPVTSDPEMTFLSGKLM